MYRVTTPTHTFTLPLDTSECNAIQITYKHWNTNDKANSLGGN